TPAATRRNPGRSPAARVQQGGRGDGERRPACLSEGMPLFLGFPFRIRGKGDGKVWMRRLLCRRAVGRA
ncbi:hypothetical protein, partial [Bilophila sp.]|uniref:hypothetical protein n=1 Tax=Bilophila sp. TaxID=1929485 RepID=UPI0030788C05